MNDISDEALNEAVTSFIESNDRYATTLMIEAVILQLRGEPLLHEHIMEKPLTCSVDDIVLLDEGKMKITTSKMVKTMLTRMKLGPSGIQTLYAAYKAHRKLHPNTTPDFSMAAVARHNGIPEKDSQIILTKMTMNEDVTTSTAGAVMPDHAPTDGRIKRRKVRELMNQQNYVNQKHYIEEP